MIICDCTQHGILHQADAIPNPVASPGKSDDSTSVI